MTPPATLNDILFGAATRYAGRPAAFRHKVDGQWTDVSISAFSTRVQHTHAALRDLGLVPGDRVAILSENRPEWAIVDFACLTARLVDVPIYPTLTPSQTAYILHDAGVRAIFVSSAEHLAKVESVRESVPTLQHVIVFDATAHAPGVTTLAAFEASGAAAVDRYPTWQREAEQVKPDDLATLIYTSGTTGEPKGVMLSHGNITSNVVAALAVFPIGPTDSCLSFLPLCHIFERMVGHYSMLQAGAMIQYASSIDAVAQELTETHPTILASVPRIYEKVYAAVLGKAHAGSAISRALFHWARRVGETRLDRRLAHRPVPAGTALAFAIADRLVFAKLRRRMGGRIRMLISGGAPLQLEICRFFLSADLTLLEGYGLTETSPVITANTPDRVRPGTVGHPLPGVEVRIAADGEILTRGPHVMLGYFNLPEATAGAIDQDGWFATGDIGEFDGDGFLRITDRKKDLIKTAGGKYVAPQPIEAMLKSNRYFANAVLLGDRRKYPIMLLVPDFGALGQWLASQQLPTAEPAALVKMPAVRDKLEREARRSLRDLAQFETPKRFLLLPSDFTIASGELTPTLKVKRKAVEEHYRDQIDAVYAETPS
ncbi:MAG TPA: long-chain fatty acid--CoA ligase [Gemmatimonadales bacterium]